MGHIKEHIRVYFIELISLLHHIAIIKCVHFLISNLYKLNNICLTYTNLTVQMF